MTGMNIKSFVLRSGAVAAASFIIAGSMGAVAFADTTISYANSDVAPTPTVYTGLANETPATYLLNPSATGVDAVEAFIETPGVYFANSGFSNLDSGWTANVVNPTYAIEYGPLSSNLTLDIGGVAPSVTVEFFAFTGCTTASISTCSGDDLTDVYQVTYTNGVAGGNSDQSSMIDQLQQMVNEISAELSALSSS
jgi:hypothetical protein